MITAFTRLDDRELFQNLEDLGRSTEYQFWRTTELIGSNWLYRWWSVVGEPDFDACGRVGNKQALFRPLLCKFITPGHLPTVSVYSDCLDELIGDEMDTPPEALSDLDYLATETSWLNDLVEQNILPDELNTFDLRQLRRQLPELSGILNWLTQFRVIPVNNQKCSTLAQLLAGRCDVGLGQYIDALRQMFYTPNDERRPDLWRVAQNQKLPIVSPDDLLGLNFITSSSGVLTAAQINRSIKRDGAIVVPELTTPEKTTCTPALCNDYLCPLKVVHRLPDRNLFGDREFSQRYPMYGAVTNLCTYITGQLLGVPDDAAWQLTIHDNGTIDIDIADASREVLIRKMLHDPVVRNEISNAWLWINASKTQMPLVQLSLRFNNDATVECTMKRTASSDVEHVATLSSLVVLMMML